jgi:hypothetical protein
MGKPRSKSGELASTKEVSELATSPSIGADVSPKSPDLAMMGSPKSVNGEQQVMEEETTHERIERELNELEEERRTGVRFLLAEQGMRIAF